MNTAHTHRTLIRIATLAFAATVASLAHAEAGENRGEMMYLDQGMPTTRSDLPRTDVKVATRAANQDGGLGNNGQATYRPFYRGVPVQSTKTSAERKAETMLAIKNHQMVHSGEFI